MKKLTLIGNIGNDAIIKDVNGLTAINFSVAITEKFKDKDGNQKEKTTWVDCSIWRKQNQSTSIVNYLKKGTKVYVEGDLSVELYSDSTNNTRFKIKCRVVDVKLLSSKSNSTSQTSGPATHTSSDYAEFEEIPQHDDLPF